MKALDHRKKKLRRNGNVVNKETVCCFVVTADILRTTTAAEKLWGGRIHQRTMLVSTISLGSANLSTNTCLPNTRENMYTLEIRLTDQMCLLISAGINYKYNITTGETKQIRFDHIYESGPSNHYIVEVFVIAEDKLLIITQASVYIINKDLQVVSQIEQPQNISRAIRLSDTNYLLGSHDGDLIPLEVSSDDEFLTQNIAIDPGHSIISLSLDAQDKIWMGSENGGLHFYDPSTGEVQHLRVDVSKPNSITSNSIWSIHKAKNGVMWLGPFKNGLSFYDPQYHKFEHLKNNPFDVNTLSNNMVNSFLDAEDGALWIGTDGGGLN